MLRHQARGQGKYTTNKGVTLDLWKWHRQNYRRLVDKPLISTLLKISSRLFISDLPFDKYQTIMISTNTDIILWAVTLMRKYRLTIGLSANKDEQRSLSKKSHVCNNESACAYGNLLLFITRNTEHTF